MFHTRFVQLPAAFALTAALGIATASVAIAQGTPSPLSPATSASTPPATPPAGSLAQPSAQSIALARDVVIGSGISRSLDIVVPQFLDQIGTNITQTRPDLIRDLNDVMEKIKPEFDAQAQDLVNSAARLYAQRLNDTQLKAIGDFFKSPAGIAYVQSQPLVLNDLLPQVQAFSQRVSQDMMTRVRAEMKARGHQL